MVLEEAAPGYKTVCKEWEVVDRWKEIMFGRIAEITECSRVEDGVLYVRVESASWRQDISYLKEQIKAAILRVTGCDTIKEIVFY
jgi:predicted nucleic acid-binding Zn ribbon protein